MQALLVILSVCFALAPLDKLELTPEDLPPLAISFQSYHEPETVISGLIANRYYASYRDVAAEHGYVDLHEDDLPEYVKEKVRCSFYLQLVVTQLGFREKRI